MIKQTSFGHAAEPALEKHPAWENLLTLLQEQLGPQIFDSWFRAIQCTKVDEVAKEIHVRAGRVTKDWVTNYYTELLNDTLDELNLSDYVFVWTIDHSENVADDPFNVDSDVDFFFETAKPLAAPPTL